VINALSERPIAKHIPYRDSQLTSLLQSSLGGVSVQANAIRGKTIFVLTISPEKDHLRETISTLNFGKRAQEVRCSNRGGSGQLSQTLLTIHDLRIKLTKVQFEIDELQRVWESCGENHDAICRCDRCIERRDRTIEPTHIPKYVHLVELEAELRDKLAAASLEASNMS
jgi:hypothetical protein